MIFGGFICFSFALFRNCANTICKDNQKYYSSRDAIEKKETVYKTKMIQFQVMAAARLRQRLTNHQWYTTFVKKYPPIISTFG